MPSKQLRGKPGRWMRRVGVVVQIAVNPPQHRLDFQRHRHRQQIRFGRAQAEFGAQPLPRIVTIGGAIGGFDCAAELARVSSRS